MYIVMLIEVRDFDLTPEVETETVDNGINGVISVSVRFPFNILKSSVISVYFVNFYLYIFAIISQKFRQKERIQ